MAYETEKQIALQAVTAAAQLCERVRREIVPQAIEKDDRSPVTLADFGSQAIICRILREAFPQDPIVAEEDAIALRQPDMAAILGQVTNYVKGIIPEATSETVPEWIDQGNGSVASRYWTLDPIDGTKGFLRKDQYAIALALVENGDVKVGALACPALALPEGAEPGILFAAVRGQGATRMALQGGFIQPIQVTTPEAKSAFRFVESVEAGHGHQSLQAAVAQAVGIHQPSIRMDSQAKYGAVACGEAVLYLRLPSPKTPNYREKIWDHAAGVIVVEEAGGRVTDMQGQPLDFSQGATLVNNQGIVASNGTIHDRAIAALRSDP